MKKMFLVTLSTMLFLSTFFGASVSAVAAKGPKILQFDTMVGVPAGLTGTQSQVPLRGISGGGIPWMLSDAFPATIGPASAGGGDATIETDVVLPQPCIAPIIFVTSPGGSWFAATGL